MDIRDGTTMSQEDKERYAKITARVREYTFAQMELEEEALAEEARKFIEGMKARKQQEQETTPQ